MAELDYAFHAESIRLEAGGLLNALGMSFTHLEVGRLPISLPVVIGGRCWLHADEQEVELTLAAEGPEDTYSINFSHLIRVLPNEPELDGRRSASFALHFVLPVTVYGRYRFQVAVGGSRPHNMAFLAVADGRGLLDSEG